jgi:hypothetical protein
VDYSYNIIHAEPIFCEDPMNISSTVYEYNSTIEGSKLNLYCKDNPDEVYTAQCYENETWIPNIALITCGGQSTTTIGRFYMQCHMLCLLSGPYPNLHILSDSTN